MRPARTCATAAASAAAPEIPMFAPAPAAGFDAASRITGRRMLPSTSPTAPAACAQLARAPRSRDGVRTDRRDLHTVRIARAGRHVARDGASDHLERRACSDPDEAVLGARAEVAFRSNRPRPGLGGHRSDAEDL